MELKQLWRWQRWQLQKTIDLMIKTTALHVHHAFSTFLWRPLHDYDVKPPNLTFCGGRGHTTTNFPSSFLTWIKSLRIQLQEKATSFPGFSPTHPMGVVRVGENPGNEVAGKVAGLWHINPLSPDIHIQILQTDLHTLPLRISWENLIKHQGIFSFVIIFYILTTLSLDNVWTLLGENCCWSLLRLKGLSGSK